MTIDTSNGVAFQIDEADLLLLGGWRWKAYSHGHTWYVRRQQNARPRNLYLHRVLMNPPVGYEVDHINRDGLDNSRSNLRIVTRDVNQRNTRVSHFSKSGAKGIELTKFGRYSAYYSVARRQVRIGSFRTLEEAVAARTIVITELGLA